MATAEFKPGYAKGESMVNLKVTVSNVEGASPGTEPDTSVLEI